MRPLRNSDPEIFRLLTIRTVNGKFLMPPNKKVRRLIGGIIARYQEKLSVRLFAYQFLSNHPHLIAMAPLANIDEFMENVNREISRRCNFYLHREGPFWGRRYDDQEILSEADLLEAFLYVVTNPCRHGLVSDVREWTGLNCFKQVLDERPRYYSFHHYAAKSDEERVTTHALRISVLPQFAGLTRKQRRKKLLALIEDRMQHIREGRYKDGGGFVGMEIIQAQDPNDTPRNMSRSPRPPCYTFDTQLRKEWKRRERLRRERYDEASTRYRLGELTVEFPLFTFPPPVHRKPRLFPFTPLSADFLNQLH